MRKPEDIARQMAEARNKAGNKGKKPVLMADLQPASEPKKAPALPAITENDLNYAKSVHSEYENKGKKIDFDSLCQLIREIRHDLNKYQTDFNAGMLSMDLNFWNLLCSDDIEFTAVTIDTNKGQIRIPASSKVFEDIFKKPIETLKSKRPEVTEAATKEFTYFYEYILFMKVWNFFKNTDLGPQQQRIAAGMILQHFSLFDLTAEAQWRPDASYSYYWQYLSDRIEKKVKRLNKRKGPGDNPHINAKSI